MTGYKDTALKDHSGRGENGVVSIQCKGGRVGSFDMCEGEKGNEMGWKVSTVTVCCGSTESTVVISYGECVQ